MTDIQFYRLKANLTQKELACAVNSAQNTIAQYESGARNPDIVTLKKLAVVLHCTTDQLLEPIKV